MKTSKLYKQIAQELNLPEEVVGAAYRSYWEFIKSTIRDIPLKQDMTEEEFSKYQTNFNLPSLGKFYCNYKRYKTIRNNLKFIKDKRQELNETEEN